MEMTGLSPDGPLDTADRALDLPNLLLTLAFEFQVSVPGGRANRFLEGSFHFPELALCPVLRAGLHRFHLEPPRPLATPARVSPAAATEQKNDQENEQ